MTAPALTLVRPHPAEPELPALTHIGIYDLARLWHENPELALQLATAEGKRHDRTSNR